MRMLPALLATALMLPTLAVAQPVTYPASSEPQSSRASNINGADTSNPVAPQLPSPNVPPGAEPRAFLLSARQALAANQSGAAQEALERAETRLLDRSTARDAASTPDDRRMIRQISDALNALAAGDRGRSMQLVNAMLSGRP